MLGMSKVLLAFSGGAQGGLLDVSPGLMIWTVITFVILLLVLKKLAWKPILNSLNERENFIRESLEKADTAQKEAEKMIADNKASIEKAEVEAQKIIAQSREYAEKLKTQIVDESKAEANKIMNDAALEIDRKNKEAFLKMKEQVAAIAIEAAEKIILANLDKEKQSKIINKYIEDISKN